MGNLLAVLGPGETVGEMTIPKDKVGFGTVCSITLNGVLLKHGIPVASIFGGLLELREGQPTRFVEIIHYDGTSIDPLEVFICSGMTDYHGAISTGNGRIGASYREVPERSCDAVQNLAKRLSVVGLGGFMQIGAANREIMGLQPSHGRIGLALIGGLNPIAILEEEGHRVHSYALAGLLDYGRLIPYQELPDALQSYV